MSQSLNIPVNFDQMTQTNVTSWLEGHYDEETKAAIRQLLRDNPQAIIDAFYTRLSFGTGGLRGIMGIGTNRMNPYTVRAATQGLANYIKTQPLPAANEKHAVFIGYDSRHHSKQFAEESAKVLAGNGIQVYLFKELRPTPLVSFGCRYKNCTAAIMVTASHNPPEYNGYKVYWSDGGQILPPHDQKIIAEVNRIVDPTMVARVSNIDHPLIELVGEEVDEAYLKAIQSLQNYPEQNQAKGHLLKVVYTSLHGTGITLVPKLLPAWGFTSLSFVDQQIIADGGFPTVASPNPEERQALALGIEKLKACQGDLLIATDPDADRVGAAVKHQDQIQLLTGNQIACLCLDHICEALTQQKRMPERAAFIKTIVTTELFATIAQAYQKPCFNVLTGFKYIAQKIREWEQDSKGYEFVFGGEESYGYLYGAYTRDKDAISIAALLCEVSLKAKLQGKTLIDVLHDLYRKYGLYHEKLLSIHFEESKAGKEQIAIAMRQLQDSPPYSIGGMRVLTLEDYQRSIKAHLDSGKKEPISLPKSDVLSFTLEDGSKLVVRPSGTEPKIKLYGGVVKKDFHSILEGLSDCEKHVDRLLKAMGERIRESEDRQT